MGTMLPNLSLLRLTDACKPTEMPVRNRDDDEEDWLMVPGTPEPMGEDEWGEWRSIPGIPKELLSVSDLGYVRGEDNKFVAQVVVPDCYLHVQPKAAMAHLGREGRISVHLLVCRAFHKEKPSLSHVCDHINKKGPTYKVRTDNRATNLRWLSVAEHTAALKENEGDDKGGNKGKNVYIRRVDWPEDQLKEFTSGLAAAQWIWETEGWTTTKPDNSGLGKVKDTGKLFKKTYYITSLFLEPNTPLPATPSDRLSGLAEDEEKWVDWPFYLMTMTKDVNGPRSIALRISSRGRLQRRNRSVWDVLTTLQPSSCNNYIDVTFVRMGLTYLAANAAEVAISNAKLAAWEAERDAINARNDARPTGTKKQEVPTYSDNAGIGFHRLVYSCFGPEAQAAGSPIWPLPATNSKGDVVDTTFLDGNTANFNASNLALRTGDEQQAHVVARVIPRDSGGIPLNLAQARWGGQ